MGAPVLYELVLMIIAVCFVHSGALSVRQQCHRGPGACQALSANPTQEDDPRHQALLRGPHPSCSDPRSRGAGRRSSAPCCSRRGQTQHGASSRLHRPPASAAVPHTSVPPQGSLAAAARQQQQRRSPRRARHAGGSTQPNHRAPQPASGHPPAHPDPESAGQPRAGSAQPGRLPESALPALRVPARIPAGGRGELTAFPPHPHRTTPAVSLHILLFLLFFYRLFRL